jgi:hypothetical protein
VDQSFESKLEVKNSLLLRNAGIEDELAFVFCAYFR